MKRLKNTPPRYRMPLREYRVAAGLTQAVLAKKLGIRSETYSRIETGVQPLTERMQRLIAHHLDLTPEVETIAFGLPGQRAVGSVQIGSREGNDGTGLGSSTRAPHLRLVDGPSGRVAR